MTRLKGKVCLITGAAKGQGAAEARLFAAQGARVWLTDVLDEEGAALAAQVDGIYRHLDVCDQVAWDSLVDEMVSAEGRIDVLLYSKSWPVCASAQESCKNGGFYGILSAVILPCRSQGIISLS